MRFFLFLSREQEMKVVVLLHRVKQKNQTLTEPLEVMAASSRPNSLPQAAPISSDGMKTPADTARP